MNTFLEEKARHIYSRHPENLDKVCILLPNKRASVYFQKCLSELFDKPFFAPKILTIGEWVDANTPSQILEQTALLFQLYEIHISIEQTTAEEFGDFSKWGKMMLSDFDEIDRYLIDPEELFCDLRNIKDIENWSLGAFELSEGQKNFISFLF